MVGWFVGCGWTLSQSPHNRLPLFLTDCMETWYAVQTYNFVQLGSPSAELSDLEHTCVAGVFYHL